MPKADPNPKAANPKAKDAFWLFARRMLRYYWLLAAAFVMVVLSSLTLVAGILGSSPILDSLIGEGHHKDLQEIAAGVHAHNLNSKFEFIQHIQVPQATIDHLPTG